MNDDWYGIIQQHFKLFSLLRYVYFTCSLIFDPACMPNVFISFRYVLLCLFISFYFALSMLFLILFLFIFFSVVVAVVLFFFFLLLAIPLSFYCQTLLARNPTILCLPLNILSLSFGISLFYTQYNSGGRARTHMYLCLHMRVCVLV